MKKITISVLITNYNKAKFLSKSLSKICNQNFRDYEIILYDDASNDDSVKIIKKFKKVKLIRNKKKIKEFSALNQIDGILKIYKKSRGKIICLMDADDFFHRSKLKKINEIFKKNKNYNSVFNFPDSKDNQFFFKDKKDTNFVWTTIFPTSCISIRRSVFKRFIKYLKKDKFEYLEIDARLTIFLKFFYNEYNLLKSKLTIYNYDEKGITSNINFFSKKWWIRRKQAFNYMIYIFKKRDKNFKKGIDYYLTTTISFFLKVFF